MAIIYKLARIRASLPSPSRLATHLERSSQRTRRPYPKCEEALIALDKATAF